VEEAGILIGRGLLQHGRQGAGDGQPLVRAEQLVDAHTDQEDDNLALDARGVSAGEHICHASS
jgi:hypothetical protein